MLKGKLDKDYIHYNIDNYRKIKKKKKKICSLATVYGAINAINNSLYHVSLVLFSDFFACLFACFFAFEHRQEIMRNLIKF